MLPDVDKLEVSGLGDGLIDALVHGVHDEHDSQWEPDSHVQVQVAKEESNFSNHQQAEVNFTQHYMATEFIKVRPIYALFLMRNCVAFRNNCHDIVKIDTWSRFHQCSSYSFYARRSRKRKKYSKVISIFLPFWDLWAQKLYVERWWNWHLVVGKNVFDKW